MRVLVTGASGFAGGYLASACAAAGDEVVGISRTGSVPAGSGVHGVAVDLRDGPAARRAVAQARPEVIYHLAALSSVGRSWEEPAATLQGNAVGAVELLEAIRSEAPQARVVWVSSCEVYGTPESLPLREDAPVRPASPYAVSKVAGEQLARVYADAYGLDLVCARPFSHTGPGQRSIFIVSSLARQAAAALLAGAEGLRVLTGNPETRRDFSDVRDVVGAYRELAARPECRGAYNVCSGRSVSTSEQVELLASLVAPLPVEHVVDPARVRPREVMELVGSPERLAAATGWRARIPLEQTVRQMVAWWRERLASAEAGAAR